MGVAETLQSVKEEWWDQLFELIEFVQEHFPSDAACRRSSASASAVSRLPVTLALRSDTKRRRVSSGDDGGQSDVLSFIVLVFGVLFSLK